MVQLELTGLQLKKRGMKLSAEARSELLAEVRKVAVEIARDGDGTTNSDKVRYECLERGIPYEDLGPAAGSVFRVGFSFTGIRTLSTHKDNHAREIKRWRVH